MDDAISRPEAERWLPVIGYEPYYEVSDLGRVRSLRRGLIMKPSHSNPGGYGLLILADSRSRTAGRYVHHLVLEAFDRLREPGEETRHLDGNPLNARLDNLCWGSSGENKRDQVRHGTHPQASKDACDNGHEYTEASVHITYHPDGSIKRRACRICCNERVRAWEARNTASGKTCAAEEGCDKIARAKGLCSMHYARQHKAGKVA